MGMFKVDVTLTNPKDPDRSFSEKFWVETGALYTFVPEDRMEEIGLSAWKWITSGYMTLEIPSR